MDGFKDLFGGTRKRLSFHYYDDGQIEFRQLLVKDASFQEKKGDDVINAWPDLRRNQYFCSGYGKVQAGYIMPTCDRDIIWEVHHTLADSEKPEKGQKLIKEFITKVAESQRYKAQNKPQSTFVADVMTVVLGGILALQGIALFITIISNRGG